MLIQRIAKAIAFATIFSSTPLWAAANEYKFELVSAKPSGAGKNEVTVRLLRMSDGKAVPDAVIFESKADMGPSGMATMPAPVEALSPKDGIYRFAVDPGMAGTWALHLAAKIQGEPETVRGTVDADLVK